MAEFSLRVQSGLRAMLLANGLIIATGIDGVYSHGQKFGAIIEGLANAITVAGACTDRTARFVVAQQKNGALKFEILSPATSSAKLTTLMSCNCHLDHFADPFAIHLANGETAHSACVGFGMERIALALLHRHGLELDRWPSDVCRMLSLGWVFSHTHPARRAGWVFPGRTFPDLIV